MTICVTLDENNYLVRSFEQPCTSYYLVESTDLTNSLTSTDVLALFGAATSLYALVFLFRMIRRVMNI